MQQSGFIGSRLYCDASLACRIMLSLDNLTRCIIKVLVLGGQVHEHFTELGERKRRTAAGNQRIVALLLSVAARYEPCITEYLNRLGKKYPSLSIGDKKICAYLKMGLSSKDIAPLMNMSVHSVEMARYRLRKKLELDRSVNLSEFLQNF